MFTRSISKLLGYQPTIARRLARRCASTSWDWQKRYPDVDAKLVSENIQRIASTQLDSVKNVVPWFLENMPAHYFLNVDEPLRLQQLQAMAVINNFQQDDMSIKLEEVVGNTKQLSFVTAGSGTKVLERELAHIGGHCHGENLRNVRVYNSDSSSASMAPGSLIRKTLKELQEREDRSPRDLDAAISPVDVEGLLSTYSIKLLDQPSSQPHVYEELYSAAAHGEQTAVDLAVINPSSCWLTKATSNVPPEQVLKDTVHYMCAQGFKIDQVMVDCVEEVNPLPNHSLGCITLTRISFRHGDLPPEAMALILSDVKRLKWIHDDAILLGLPSENLPGLGLERAEILHALCALAHGVLSEHNPEAFLNAGAALQTLQYDDLFTSLGARVVDLFLAKFKPDQQYSGSMGSCPAESALHLRRELEALETSGGEEEDLPTLDAVEVIRTLVDLVEAASASNISKPDRGALAISISPAAIGIPDTELTNTLSNAHIVFVQGRNFFGFHCHFAPEPSQCRVEFRVVVPTSVEMYSTNSAGLGATVWRDACNFDLLSQALPARGGHSIALLNKAPVDNEAEVVRRGVFRAFEAAVMDVEFADLSPIALRYDIPYLMLRTPTNSDLADQNWVLRALQRRAGLFPTHYEDAPTSMSVPPRFGQVQALCASMLSESLVAYLVSGSKHVLRLDPHKESFSVKIFGDEPIPGVVNLNTCDPYVLLPLLFRDFGIRCKVTSLAIGRTYLEDPNGLDHEEILRLIHGGLPLEDFSTELLSVTGGIIQSTSDADAVASFVRAIADVCIPCGGKNFGIGAHNWKSLLRHCSLSPLSRLVIEGTPDIVSNEAIMKLQGVGVHVVSHAAFAKGPIMARELVPFAAVLDAGLPDDNELSELSESNLALLSDFVRGSVQSAAMKEAHVVFREYAWNLDCATESATALLDVTRRVAAATSRLKVIIAERLEAPENSALRTVGAKFARLQWCNQDDHGRLYELPTISVFRNSFIGATLASMYVCREGLAAVETFSDEMLFESICSYFDHYDHIRDVVRDLSNPETAIGVAHKEMEQVFTLLDEGGASAAVNLEEE